MIFPSPMSSGKYHEISQMMGFSPQRQAALFHHYYSQFGEFVVDDQGNTHYPGGACLFKSGAYEYGIDPKHEPTSLESAEKIVRYWRVLEVNVSRQFHKFRDQMIESPSSANVDPRHSQLLKLRDKYREIQSKREHAQQVADDLNPRIVKADPDFDQKFEQSKVIGRANEQSNLEKTKQIRI